VSNVHIYELYNYLPGKLDEFLSHLGWSRHESRKENQAGEYRRRN
jgi:hypothetical protein